jgi:hypothetical protein
VPTSIRNNLSEIGGDRKFSLELVIRLLLRENMRGVQRVATNVSRRGFATEAQCKFCIL